MKAKALLIAALAALTGCAVVPLPEYHQMCSLLDIAIRETDDLAPAWFTTAGALRTDFCGDPTGRAKGEYMACHAASRTGYGESVDDCLRAVHGWSEP